MHGNSDHKVHYMHFAIMLAVSFLFMFGFMYAMVDRLANVYPNINQAYMAGLMVAPMAVLELILMGSMYPSTKANRAIIALSAVLLMVCWVGIRDQLAVNDKSFLRAMIPHHAGAILMCQNVALKNSEVKKLCADIISSQTQEIAQMKDILARNP
jgi:ABC-type Na+ efflux pump permease subunit